MPHSRDDPIGRILTRAEKESAKGGWSVVTHAVIAGYQGTKVPRRPRGLPLSVHLLPRPGPLAFTQYGVGRHDSRARRIDPLGRAAHHLPQSSLDSNTLSSFRCDIVPNYRCSCCYITSLLAADLVFPWGSFPWTLHPPPNPKFSSIPPPTAYFAAFAALPSTSHPLIASRIFPRRCLLETFPGSLSPSLRCSKSHA